MQIAQCAYCILANAYSWLLRGSAILYGLDQVAMRFIMQTNSYMLHTNICLHFASAAAVCYTMTMM